MAVLVAAEWPRLSPRFGLEGRRRRAARAPQIEPLRVLRPEDDDFRGSVERDLAQLPTTKERDQKALVHGDVRCVDHGRVRQDPQRVLHVLRLLVVGDLEPHAMTAGREPPTGTVIVMRLPFGACVGVRPVPATLAKIDLGSRPDPVSEATNVRILRAGPNAKAGEAEAESRRRSRSGT